MVRNALLGLVVALSVPAAAAVAQDRPTTVFVVRHAEKGAEGQDPSLTDAGRARAAALTHLLADAGITAVYTSQFKRTIETGAPVAAKAGISPTVVGAGKNDELAAAIRALPAGSRALVVSHSNLVPAIVEKLSGQKVGELTDLDYDRIYVVTLAPGGGGSVLYLHFGAPSASGGGAMRE
ncbi:MAG: histidine phosphatase family protein [Gemmatimonadetes bacterium]|nr:histidine phosphatase family protein [Gemmatimonadota bacterium]MCC7131245.1 histidine phosphatase family protein [Gemmatimonadales bacterium]